MTPQPPTTMTISEFLQQTGRKQWTDEMRRALVLQIQDDLNYTSPTQITRTDFGKYSAAFRIKRFDHSHQQMINTLFPAKPDHRIGEAVQKIGNIVLDQSLPDTLVATANLKNHPPWFWVAIVNLLIFVFSKIVLGGLLNLVTHINTFLPCYLALGNLAFAYRSTRLLENGMTREGTVGVRGTGC